MMPYTWREAPEGDFAVIGSPITHSLSPTMHNAAYRADGLSYRYHAIEVPEHEFEDALMRLNSLGYQGLNVTIPNKNQAFLWCNSTCKTSTKLHVCNTLNLRESTGINTDVPGFLKSLPGHAPRALILGAGGSARAVAFALHAQGTELAIWNRTRSRAEELISDLDIKVELIDKPNVAGFGLIVNTTSTSINSEPLQIDWSEAEPLTTLAYDLAYLPTKTPFLAQAATAGVPGIDGRRMLMEQGAFSYEWWLNRPAPRPEMWEAIQP